jgi:hypothetical protein
MLAHRRAQEAAVYGAGAWDRRIPCPIPIDCSLAQEIVDRAIWRDARGDATRELAGSIEWTLRARWD